MSDTLSSRLVCDYTDPVEPPRSPAAITQQDSAADRSPVPQAPATGLPATRRGQVEQALASACLHLLDEGRPWAQLSVDEITRRAGIGRTAFYFYVPDKRALLLQLAGGLADELESLASRWWDGESRGAEGLGRQLDAVVALMAEHGSLVAAVIEAAAVDPEVAAFWHAVVGRFAEATAERIEHEQGRRVAAMPAEETAWALVWMTERTCHQQFARPGQGDPERFGEALRSIWLRSIYG